MTSRLALLALLLASCTQNAPPPPPIAPRPAPSTVPAPLPTYLARLARDGDLYARDDAGGIQNAPAADVAVLRGYPQWKDQGAPTGPMGERLTILTAKLTYAPGEEVRVIHVHEAPQPGVALYVMGPKAIFGEYVDGVLSSKAAAAPLGSYDGAVVQSPEADHNYEASVYRLARGAHTIEWRFATLSGPSVLRSNVLHIDVR